MEGWISLEVTRIHQSAYRSKKEKSEQNTLD